MKSINKDKENALNHKYLLSILDYNPSTGIFIWKKSRGRVSAGSIAGGEITDGYIGIRIDGTRFMAHRLAWFYCFEEWPESLLDHEDTDPSNNAIENLREASNSSNNMNKGVMSISTTGYTGVTFDKSRNKYMVRVSINGVSKNLGRFNTIEEAIAVREFAAKEAYGEFYRDTINGS